MKKLITRLNRLLVGEFGDALFLPALGFERLLWLQRLSRAASETRVWLGDLFVVGRVCLLDPSNERRKSINTDVRTHTTKEERNCKYTHPTQEILEVGRWLVVSRLWKSEQAALVLAMPREAIDGPF